MAALGLRHLHLGGGDGLLRLLQARLRLVLLRQQAVDLQPCQRLAGAHEIALAHQQLLQPAGKPARDRDLGRLDAAVAADEAGRHARSAPRPPPEQRGGAQHEREAQGENGFPPACHL